MPPDSQWRDMYIIGSVFIAQLDEVFVPFFHSHGLMLAPDKVVKLKAQIKVVLDLRHDHGHGETSIRRLKEGIDAIVNILTVFGRINLNGADGQERFTVCPTQADTISHIWGAVLVVETRADAPLVRHDSGGMMAGVAASPVSKNSSKIASGNSKLKKPQMGMAYFKIEAPRLPYSHCQA